MRFACLGSGSQGNAWIVESGRTRVLIDCGFTVRETEARLARLGVVADTLAGILITHEHSDHGRGAKAFSRRHGCPVWLTHGCHARLAAVDAAPERVRMIDSHTRFEIDGLEFHPFPVPHDAREPVQFRVSDGARHWGLLTDAGHITAHMQYMLNGCQALVLECNHDVRMLREGPYPPALKARILGRYGHLDNQAAAKLLSGIDHTRLQHVIAAHLSEENNSPMHARAALADTLGCTPDWIGIADQQDGLEWRTID